MFAGARPGTEADAVLGAVPSWVYAPPTVEDAREFVESSGREGLALGFIGGGTALELGAPLSRFDALLRTTGFAKIIEYAPADMIVTVEAGMTLAALSETLRRQGQWLALDPPAPERATVGGVIAANSFGPRRVRFGSVRDLLIGISVVRADGSLARGGGKVVKNVAGFDIPKLMCGSLGTLALIATATFRLHPLPEMQRTVIVPSCGAENLRELLARVKLAQLEPTSVVGFSTGLGRFEVALRFEGFAAGVNQQVTRFAELQQTAGKKCEPLNDSDAQTWWMRQDDARLRGELRVKVAALPNQIEEILPRLDAVREQLSEARFVWYASLGLGFLSGTPSDLTAAARALAEARSQLQKAGGTLVLQGASPTIRRTIGEWGTNPDAFSIMQRMKERFDPQQRLNPGRFVGGI
jgi:glycolate oxidase FAD binding subunit